MKKLIYILLALIILSYLVFKFWYLPYQVNDRIAIKDTQGNQLNIPIEKPYILVYIQSWCKDCVAEIPCLMKFSKANDIPIYLVTDEDSILMKKFKGRFDYEIPIYYTKSKLKENGVMFFPTAYFYNKNKVLVDVKEERIDSAVLTRFLEIINGTIEKH